MQRHLICAASFLEGGSWRQADVRHTIANIRNGPDLNIETNSLIILPQKVLR
jgi:hypothetical protein